jgi:hypothetical protein
MAMKFLQKRSVLRSITVPVAAATLSLTALTMPASAHDVRVFIGDFGYGGIRYNETEFYACDTKADGIGVRTAYAGGFISDGNGEGAPCGRKLRPPGVTSFRVCITENNVVRLCTEATPI